jgi:deoxycytidylate deaminase
VNAKQNVIEGLIPINHVEPYYKIARKEAQSSPCLRRRYGVAIGFTGYATVVTHNARVTRACDTICVRERFGVTHGSQTELGAEVHAEQAALIEAPSKGFIFVLAGWKGEEELKGVNVYPCLVCARMIKYAGYRWIYIKDEADQLTPVSIYDIIEYREQELSPVYE